MTPVAPLVQHALNGALAELKVLRADFLGLTLRPVLAAGVQCDLGRDHAEVWAGAQRAMTQK